MSASNYKPCTDEEKAWAALARSEFLKENYDTCLIYLNKILAKRPNDLKVHHNKAIAQFYQSKQRKITEFSDHLNSLCTKANLRTGNLETLDDMEHSFLLYNKAVLLYHNYQYQAALVIVQKLWQFFESLTEDLAKKVSILLLELYLSTNQAERAINIIHYLEKLFDQDSSEKEKEKDKENADNEILDVFTKKLIYYKAKSFLMLKSTKGCKREIKLLVNSGESASAIYLRSQLEYMRGNHHKALKVLNTSIAATNPQLMSTKFEETGDMYSVLYFMNLACIHLKMGKPYLACLYNHKAHVEHVNTLDRLKQEGKDNLVLWTHNISLQYKIKFNSAIFLLHTKRNVEAFDFFQQASNFFHTNPRIWLHLAECCIQKHQPDNSDQFNIQDCKDKLAKEHIGMGANRKMLLSSPQIQRTSIESPAIPYPTLEFASICLKNAYILLGPTATSDDSLRNAILTASAYVALCIGDVYLAAAQAETLLAQPNLSGVHHFLGTLYWSEALIHKDDVPGALRHLNSDILENFDPPSGWYPNSLSTAKVAQHYNKAMVLSLMGESEKATEILKQVGPFKDSDTDFPIKSLLLSLYLNIQQGHEDSAKTTIKQYLPQFRK